MPVEPLQIAAVAVIVAFGDAFTVTLFESEALQPFDVTVTPIDAGPEVDVNVIAFVPLPLVIVPFVIVQLYVAPATEATEAEPEAPLQIAAGAVIVALCEPDAVQPAEVIVTLSVVVPEAPAVKVIAFVLVALVIVPLVIDHAYVAPACAGTLALLPVEPAQTVDGAVIVATGFALTVTLCDDEVAQLAPSVTVTPRTVVPEGPAVKVIVLVLVALVIVPFVIVQA